jgi:predicted small lipoprotein YifL
VRPALLLLGALAVWAALASGCGHRGALVPPEDVRHATIPGTG